MLVTEDHAFDPLRDSTYRDETSTLETDAMESAPRAGDRIRPWEPTNQVSNEPDGALSSTTLRPESPRWGETAGWPDPDPIVQAGCIAVPSPSLWRAGELSRGRRRNLDAVAMSLDALKIVYWGPGRSGKTTNVKWLHGCLRPELRGQLISLDSPGERTLYFDCLPMELGTGGAAPVQLRLYTVPGQPRHRLTRKLVLDSVDGIVFVWDARARRLNANLNSLLEMRDTLAELGRSWSEIPRVFQYNKLDLPERIPTEQLDHVLDRMGEHGPRISSVATRGEGVVETLGAVMKNALAAYRSRIEPEPLAAAGL